MERGTCKSCGAMAHQFASAYRVKNELTTMEENYYQGTAPHILMELRQIKGLLMQLVDLIGEKEK